MIPTAKVRVHGLEIYGSEARVGFESDKADAKKKTPYRFTKTRTRPFRNTYISRTNV